jgi:hypothetical protein
MRNDSRRSFRITTSEDRQHGVFRFGKRQHQVLVLNGSADGFALLMAQPIEIANGAVAQLRADDAWYKVLVVRQEPTPDGYLLGVERLADIPDPDAPASADWAGGRQNRARSNASSAIALVGIAICAALSAYLIAGRPTIDAVLRSLNSEPRLEESQVPLLSVPQQFSASDNSTGVRLVSRSLLSDAAPSRLDEARLLIRQQLLLDEAVASSINLTHSQLFELRRVLQREAARLEAGDDQWETIRQAEAQILAILTPQQASRWRAIELP